MASPSVMSVVPVAGMVPRSIIRITIPIGRSRVTIYRWGIAVGSRWSIIPITSAADGSTKERTCPNRCPYKRPWAVPPMTPRVAWLREGQCHPNEKNQSNQKSLFHGILLWCICTNIYKHLCNKHTRGLFSEGPEITGVSLLPLGKIRHNCRMIRIVFDDNDAHLPLYPWGRAITPRGKFLKLLCSRFAFHHSPLLNYQYTDIPITFHFLTSPLSPHPDT